MISLKNKIKSKKAILGVIGLGYVGLPLAVEGSKSGFYTIGFEINQNRTNMINQGQNYINDVNDNDLTYLVKKGMLKATSDFKEAIKCDCICICVPTPLDLHQQPDTSHIKRATESITPYLHKEMLIILESTSYPGTTEELVKPILEKSGLKCGKDFYLAFSPERVDPGNTIYKINNTPKVVGGCTKKCTDLSVTLYKELLKTPIFRVSSPAVAEMEKILENTYRNINIGLVNALAILCNKMNISIWEVIDAAKSKPYGFQAFYPGPGLGGHCIPLDPYYLSWKAREYGCHTTIIESSMMINDKMPEYCVERAGKILNRLKKSLNGSKILILGVAYKQNIKDYRESPAIKVIEKLIEMGSEVCYYDPFVEKIEYENISLKGITNLTPNIIKNKDLIMITTAHSNVNYKLVQKYAKAIFDTKNVMCNITPRDNIEVL